MAYFLSNMSTKN